MSKSYDNTITLRDSEESITRKIRTMPTDPARVRRTDPGDPAKCPVFSFHRTYSSDSVQEWVTTQCKSAGIGCLDCKQPVIEAVLAELKPMQERAAALQEDPTRVRSIVADGCERARRLAADTLRDVRESMGLSWS
jgi:tryptophanyl-tRNA synthetase